MNVNGMLEILKNKDFDILSLPLEFDVLFHGKFRLDNRAKKVLNKTMDTDFIAVYRGYDYYSEQWKGDSISWDAEHVYIVTSKRKLIGMYNSEWASIEKVAEE